MSWLAASCSFWRCSEIRAELLPGLLALGLQGLGAGRQLALELLLPPAGIRPAPAARSSLALARLAWNSCCMVLRLFSVARRSSSAFRLKAFNWAWNSRALLALQGHQAAVDVVLGDPLPAQPVAFLLQGRFHSLAQLLLPGGDLGVHVGGQVAALLVDLGQLSLDLGDFPVLGQQLLLGLLLELLDQLALGGRDGERLLLEGGLAPLEEVVEHQPADGQQGHGRQVHEQRHEHALVLGVQHERLRAGGELVLAGGVLDFLEDVLLVFLGNAGILVEDDVAARAGAGGSAAASPLWRRGSPLLRRALHRQQVGLRGRRWPAVAPPPGAAAAGVLSVVRHGLGLLEQPAHLCSMTVTPSQSLGGGFLMNSRQRPSSSSAA